MEGSSNFLEVFYSGLFLFGERLERIAATVGGGLGLGDGEGLGGPCSICGGGLVIGLSMHTSVLGRGFVFPRHVCMSSSGSVWERKKMNV